MRGIGQWDSRSESRGPNGDPPRKKKATASCTHEANQRFKSNTPVTLNRTQLNVKKINANKKVIEIKFLYFLKPNSSLAFFLFLDQGRRAIFQVEVNSNPFRYSQCWKGKITFSDIPCILLCPH